MRNVKMISDGKKLTIEIDLKDKGELSKSQKSFVIATTKGNVDVPNTPLGTKIGLNLYRRA